MKDTWNVYDWGKNLVNDRFRLISNLLLLFIIPKIRKQSQWQSQLQ